MNSQQDFEVTYKFSDLRKILDDLDEVPHKWSRKIVDGLWQVIGPRMRELQESQEPPQS